VLGNQDAALQTKPLAEVLLPELDRDRVSQRGEPVVEDDFL